MSTKRRSKPRPSARDALINAFRDLTSDDEFLDWFERSLDAQGFVIAEKSWVQLGLSVEYPADKETG